MHNISKQDLNSAELDTFTKSCSPTIVITTNGEMQTHEEATVYVKELYIFLTMKVFEGLSASSSCSFPSSTSMTPSRQEIDHPTSSSSSSTSPTTTVSNESETRAREDLSGIDSHPALVSSSHVERTERGDPLTKPTKNPKPNKNENHETERGDPLYSDIPEWQQEFRENLVDDRAPERRDSHASSSHEPSLEPTLTRSVDLGKHSVYAHFPKDRNCEICQRTKITNAPVQKTHWRRCTSCRKFW